MIVEFAGLPRSGKSTCIDAAKGYFSRRGITVRIAGEAVRFCPFGNHHRVAIACWAANCALNAVLEASLDTDPKTLTLQDRGLFDALAFLRLLWKEDYISRDTLSCLEEYFADRKWAERVDLVILFNAEPEAVLERDIAQLVAEQLHAEDKDFRGLPGTIMNKSTLHALRDCYKETQAAFEDRFNIQQMPTSGDLTTELAKLAVEVVIKEYERRFGDIA